MNYSSFKSNRRNVIFSRSRPRQNARRRRTVLFASPARNPSAFFGRSDDGHVFIGSNRREIIDKIGSVT